MTDCLFCGIVAGDVPAEIVYQDLTTMAFKDIAPAAPLHVLVVPRRHIDDASVVTPDDGPILADLLMAARAVADDVGEAETRTDGPGAGGGASHTPSDHGHPDHGYTERAERD